jgi:uncharacterized protein with PhoU and TrkA domain
VLLLWLGGLTLVFLLVIAAIIVAARVGPGDEETSFGEGLWLGLTHSLDPGTFVEAEGGKFRLLMFIVTIVGILIAATIIGVVSTGIDNRLQLLRRGRSLVVEDGHTVIIGRSDKLATVIGQIAEANRADSGHPAIVVLTPDDTVEVSDDIRAAVPNLAESRLVVRSGVATRLHDLNQVRPQSAKSIVVLQGQDESDAHVVKVVLAVNALVPDLAGVNVVAEVNKVSTAEALRDAVGPALVTVTPREVIGRIGAQVSRSKGIGAVFEEVLDFAGDEVYSVPVDEPWVGRSYGELLLASSDSAVIGIRRADGTTMVNPTPETAVAAGDAVIAIAEDATKLVLDRDPVAWTAEGAPRRLRVDRQQERTLIVGWSDLAPLIVAEIDTHVLPGSQLHVFGDPRLHDFAEIEGGLSLRNQTLVLHHGDPISRRDIERMMAAGPFDHVMVIGERGLYDVDEADARTLLSLMHVRRLTPSRTGRENIVAEILDPETVDLGGGTSSDSDFIVSQKLISLLVAQLAEDPELADVFADLFSSDGSIIDLFPVADIMPVGEATFEEVVRAARDCAATAIGVVCAAGEGHGRVLHGGVMVNPHKDRVLPLAEGDQVILLRRVGEAAVE